jgi:hypothetical protein
MVNHTNRFLLQDCILNNKLNSTSTTPIVFLKLANQGNVQPGLEQIIQSVGAECDPIQPLNAIGQLQAYHPSSQIVTISNVNML